MVRLSLIVLGLLAAAWCSTGDAKGVFIATTKIMYTQMSCGANEVVKIGMCYTMKPCSGISFSSNSVKCISGGAVKYIRRTCNLMKSCRVHGFIKKGSYVCQYGCVRRY